MVHRMDIVVALIRGMFMLVAVMIKGFVYIFTALIRAASRR
jgi:hypothetical protein